MSAQVSTRKIPYLSTAIGYFHRFADQENMAFGSVDVCFARTHAMCRQFESDGLTAKKVWVFQGQKPLTVTMPNGSIVEWKYHVASAADVRMPDKSTQTLVFDPALFDGPVTISRWCSVMNGVSGCPQITMMGEPPRGFEGDYTPAVATVPEHDEAAIILMQSYARGQSLPRMVFRNDVTLHLPESEAMQYPASGQTWQVRPLNESTFEGASISARGAVRQLSMP